MNKKAIKERMKGAKKRFFGETREWREGYLWALHEIAEDGSFKHCLHDWDNDKIRERFDELVGT